MKKAINYLRNMIKLLRVKHWIKNGLIYFPLFFSLQLTNWSYISKSLLGFLAFCLVSSAVYVLNDIRDREKDRLHSTKRNRPIASGAIGVPVAAIVALLFVGGAACILVWLRSAWGGAILALYFLLNVGYSCGLKNIPIVDIVILASGFVLRVMFGGVIIGEEVSSWLFFTVLAAAFFMGMGKRRNELLTEGDETREVNKLYSQSFLEKNMYMCITLAVCFYAMWCITSPTVERFANPGITWTVPLLLVIFLRYSYRIERAGEGGDPINVLLKDYVLLGLVVIFLVYTVLVVYVPIPFFHEISKII